MEAVMLNSEPISDDGALPQDDASLNAILRSGARGAVVLAGVATATVVAIWLAFYLAVFLPRAIAS
jgi:hypothetical protein